MAPVPDHAGSKSIEQLFAEALDAQKRNDFLRAERLYEIILKRRPEMPPALHYLGFVLHRRGLHEKARHFLGKAQQLAPDEPEFLQNYAHILAEQGRTDEAVPLLERLYALRPDTPYVIRALVIALTRLDQWAKASDALENWLARHPKEYGLWLLAGDLRLHETAYELAQQAWERAGQGSFELREAALVRMGNALLQQANPAAARKVFEAAVTHNPDSADAHSGLATTAGQLGDFTNLEREAMEAIRLNPRCYAAWYQLTLSPGTNDEDTARRMQRAIVQAGDDPQAWALHMALGRVLDRGGHHDDAFAAFAEAHRRRARIFPQNFAQERSYFASVRRELNTDFVRRRPDAGTAGFRPIFIVGMPRSGTTLVEAILGAHPTVVAGGEMHFLYDRLEQAMGPAPEQMAPAWLAQADDATLASLARDWRAHMDGIGGGQKRVTDKFPFNFFLLGLIAILFPEADIVHVRRDPCDTCVSCYTTALTGRGLPASLSDLGAYYREYEALMEHWHAILGKERIVELEYERLVRTPEPVIRGLLTALGLDWRPECLSFHESSQPVATASLYQVRQPIYPSSIGRWQRFEPFLVPLLQSLKGEPRK